MDYAIWGRRREFSVMATIIVNRTGAAQQMFFFISSMHGDGDFSVSLPCPLPRSEGEVPHHLILDSRSPTPLRGGWVAAAAACFYVHNIIGIFPGRPHHRP